ncbi:MAG: hypothetical protein KJ667_00740, partial [Alphaproteobacteria bacterium]|nr:hypothetical protein [Alphaproteobacteria bacterium]
MNKGKKLILAVLCGLPVDHKMVKAAVSDPSAAADMLETTKISKADFLTTLGEDDPLFAHEQTWENLPRIAALLKAQGEHFTAQDFMTPLTGVLSPVRYAERTRKLDKLFSPEIWEGRRQELDKVFYSVMKVERDKLNFTEIRRAVAALTGELTPEDRLKTYNLDPSSVRTKIRNGNISELKTDLAKHGDRITKEYVFLLDSAGDNIFEFKDTFEQIDKWLPELEAHGERLGKDDFLFSVGDQKTPLQHAINHSQLPKIFRARIWHGHAAEMLELFEKLPQTERVKVDIQAVLSELKEAEYGPKVVTGKDVTLETLTSVLNEAERNNGNFFPIHALGFERVWKEMAQIRQTLAEKGQKLTLDHLRQPAGLSGDTVMMLAARGGHFDQVMAIAADAGEVLSVAELTAPGNNGKSLLDVLVTRGEAPSLFKAESWIGRGQELMTLWDKIPQDKRKDIDF